jgi:NUMOD3 motif
MKDSGKRWFSREHREKLSKAREGQKPTLGWQHSASTRKRMSESSTGTKNPMWGRKHTTEARARMSAAQEARKIREKATQKSVPSLGLSPNVHTKENFTSPVKASIGTAVAADSEFS